jgi:hypothetical protein
MAEGSAVRIAWHYITMQFVLTINIKCVKETETYLFFKHELFSELWNQSVKLEIQNARIIIEINFLIQNDYHHNFV